MVLAKLRRYAGKRPLPRRKLTPGCRASATARPWRRRWGSA